MSKPVFRTVAALAALLVSTLAVGIPAASGAPPGEAPKISWSPCYKKLATEINVDMALLGQPEVSYECATVPVPLDYDRPNGPTIQLSLVRLPASGPEAERIGSLFVNPGGPGGSGVDFAVFFGPFAGLELDPGVRAGFDIIGMDPRGVGRSSALKCFGNVGQAVEVFPWAAYPISEDEVAAQIAGDALLAEACASGTKRPSEHMSTANVARDLDLLREAVGDAGLNYLGLSYGSFLGTVYANLFPDNVRAMVIDGVLDPEAWTNEEAEIPFSTGLRSDLGAGAALQKFFELCDATPGDGGDGSCLISDGTSGDAAARFEEIIERLEDSPLEVFDPFVGETFVLAKQDVIAITLSILYNPFDYYFLGELLSLVEAGAPPGDMGAFLRELETETALVSKRGFPQYDNFVEAFPAVGCSDTRNPTDYAVWQDTGIADPDPYFAKIWDWASSPCAQWPREDDDRYDGADGFGATTPSQVLVIGNLYDPATRYEGAVAVSELLGNTHLLTVDDPGHTSLGTSFFCAGPATGGYLIDPDEALPDFCPGLEDAVGLNWIDFGAPPPDGDEPTGLRVADQLRHRLLPEISYMP
ncbi:alpha/beta hydrolase [Demequina rhizosphaerae]|uniref:alpha/beta hydrolase n=1 Tax=Demequina rhizosphaerae TaxID=1638985 RepID=UPI000A07D130|nr:alpha/beta hydrolase [Demequina rhizosphaerae]